MSKATSTPTLPYDVVIEILLPLPVKSLSRFSCVSKLWNSTILSHQFSKAQLQYSKNAKTLRPRLLLKHDSKRNFFKHLYLDSGSLLFNQTMVNADCVYPFSKYVTWVGCCNGLVCLVFDNINVALWNPCIGKFKKLPYFGSDYTKHVYRVYGFGFHVSRDDYKVVGFEISRGYERSVVMKIYSLKADCWKSIGNCKFRPHPRIVSSALANGKFYWTTECKYIAYFNLETEKHGILKQLDCVEEFHFPTNLVESEGCLYVHYGHPCKIQLWKVDHYGHPCKIQVWKVEGNGVGQEIWTKITDVGCNAMNTCNAKNTRLFYVGNGEMVFAGTDKIVIYNKRDGSFRHLRVGSSDRYMAGAFVETLISPLL